jgi:TPR repeat protein
MPDAQETSSESIADSEDTAKPQLASVSAGPAKRAAAQPEQGVVDVRSLWTSVENGDTRAEVVLASRYIRGDGVPQSCAQARVLLEAAAKRGSSDAKEKLGQLGQSGCP